MLRGRFFMNAMDELMDENENGGYFLRRETEIINAVKKTGDSPVLATRDRDGATFHRQIINGVEIDVIKINNEVVSGYPTGKLNAPYPSGF